MKEASSPTRLTPVPTAMKSTSLGNFGLVALASIALVLPAAAVSIDWVTVGNAGNVNDTTGYGGVAYNYRIAKNETTVGQYCEFLNAAAKSDPYGLYSTQMATNATSAGITRSGSAGSYSYAVIGSTTNKPITFVSWFDAARFCNWLQNGQGSGSTETGAYTLNGATSGVGFTVSAGTQVWIPTENEWYKAAYYDAVKGGSGGYWSFATRRATMPGNTVGMAGAANYWDGDYVGSGSSAQPTTNALTNVGAYGVNSASYYGTNDQTGNVWEWNGVVVNGTGRGLRGGSWGGSATNVGAINRFSAAPTFGDNYTGFRVAGVAGPTATSLAATTVRNATATLNGSATANGSTTTVAFEYGTTTAYGTTLAAIPATVTGAASTAVSADLTGLIPGATYHFRLVATSAGGTSRGGNLTFTTDANAVLTALSVDQGSMWPAFSSAVFYYELVVPFAVTSVRFTPTPAAGAAVQVNGATIASGAASEPVALAVGSQPVTILVTAGDGINTCSYGITVIRRPEVFTFNSASEVPLTVGGLKAAGSPVQFALGFAPAVGTSLTVVNNTGMAPIEGTFDNLAQGQRVDLSYGGMTYSFVANYFGGSGNDLVLEWANRRLLGWGYNTYSQLGNNGTNLSLVPGPVEMKGNLASRTVTGMATGSDFTLACSADGSVAAWGNNSVGQLGINSTTISRVPAAVDMTGVLVGKKAVAVAAGADFSLGLCADGTLAAWGGNTYGQLGDNSTSNRSVPVLVNRSGVLAGRRVVAIAAGSSHCLALCADGTLAGWGRNFSGQLGNNSGINSSVPVLVDRTGVLFGKQLIAIAAGYSHSLALCADGTLAAWGENAAQQLGNGSTALSQVPVLVNRSGALAGKTIIAISARLDFNLARCADGTVVAWGSNADGQLGNGAASGSSVPVLMNRTGALAGKSIARITPGDRHCVTLAADGTLAAWGHNSLGQLGNNSQTNSLVPVAVNTRNFNAGETVVSGFGGAGNAFALTALPSLPVVTTLPAADLADTTVTLSANVSANGSDAMMFFEWGPTAAYGFKIAATPATVSSTASTAVSAPLAYLISGNTYHYRVVSTNGGGIAVGADVVFTTPTNANLAALSLDGAELATPFAPARARYAAAVPNATTAITVTAVTAKSDATLTINGVAVASGAASAPLALSEGDNVINIIVTAVDGIETMAYQIAVTRLPTVFSFAVATSVPVVVSDFVPAGNANFALNFAPSPGAVLTVVSNTGSSPIRGTFANLEQGQRVELTFGLVSYAFVANYYGGSGNDLVLLWANTRLLTWGGGQLVPAAMAAPGVLAGKTVMALASGQNHTLALSADGSVAAWGSNGSGELGTGTTTDSTVPVAVTTSGVLAGKKVIAIAAGYAQSIALCEDGTLATWGRGFEGQLGNGTVASSIVPVLVNRSGVLAGKTVATIASGTSYMLALCTDGTLASWGSNQYGALGIGSLVNSSVPVLVDRSGVLLGKRIVSPAGGGYHGMALCDDGAVAAWGGNGNAQLGNGLWADCPTPVLVDQTGVLAGKRIVELVGGSYHSLARCTDGTLASWGTNDYGQLGNSSTSITAVPVQVVQTGALVGKSVVALAAGVFHSLALCSDGTVAAWGYNDGGQLGNKSKTQSTVPVLVNTGALRTGERILALDGGTASSVALVASPLQSATSLAATAITGTGAAMHGSVNANGNTVAVSFEYGLDITYGSSVAGSPAPVSGTVTAVSGTLTGLTPGTMYHFRTVTSGPGGTVRGADLTFTTLSDNAKLAGLGLSSGVLVPGFEMETTAYLATVPFATASVSVTPITDHPAATVMVNGTASGEIPLRVGNTAISTVITAEDGVTTKTYIISVTRLPQEFAFNAASDVPVAANGFATGGYPAPITLNYAPVPGTILTVVSNTGLGFITGTFTNLAQGQRVTLSYGGNSYDFAVNYYGGTGNDLVLQWAGTKVAAWGSNNYGQLGDATSMRRLQPTRIDASGVLADKTVVTVAAGYLHSLALCADGTLATWGYNLYGQLGNDDALPSSVPVAVDRTGALAGKAVIAISAGPFHNLALCSDGTVVAWGYNNYGQLGEGGTVTRRVPVRVNSVGVLAGKQVVSLAAAAYASFALCDDGTVAAWGYNDEGELGNGTTTTSLVPVMVTTTGALSGKRVAALAAGQYHTLALCTDGTLVSWGYNHRGQLGNNSTTNSMQPVVIGSFGALAGKTPVGIGAGAYHSLARCADGSAAAWGANTLGQLGMTGAASSSVPVAVSLAATTQIAAGGAHSLALGMDGPLFAWGDNTDGQLGDNSLVSHVAPAAVDFASGTRVMAVASSSAARHNLALVALADPIGKTVRQTLSAATGDDLLSVAFGLKSGQFPQPQRVGKEFVIRFTQPPGASSIRYGAEWSATMLPGSWAELPDIGTGNEHCFSLPAVGQLRGFYRLKVTRE